MGTCANNKSTISKNVSGGKDTISKKQSSYQPIERGRITRYEAGALYRAVKNGDVVAKPELIRDLYDEADTSPAYRGYYAERYNNDRQYYDRIYDLTDAIVNGQTKKAQEIIDKIENENISRASRRSRWYKYKNN